MHILPLLLLLLLLLVATVPPPPHRGTLGHGHRALQRKPAPVQGLTGVEVVQVSFHFLVHHKSYEKTKSKTNFYFNT